MMKSFSRLCILFALSLPIIGNAQTVFETLAGFVSSTSARNIAGGLVPSLQISNCSAVAAGVILSGSTASSIAVPAPIGSTYNPICAALSNSPAISCAMWVKASSINNSDSFANNLLALWIFDSGYGFSINLTSNRIQWGGRSVTTDSFMSVVSPSAIVFSNAWRHVVAVANYDAGNVQIYCDGALLTNATFSFGQRIFKPRVSALAARRDSFLNDSLTTTRFLAGRISPPIIDGRAWTLADVQDHRRRTGKDFLNP